MRVLLDTCVIIYLTAEPDKLSKDVRALIEDYDTQLCMSVESVRELIVAFNNGGLVSKRWKTSEDMLRTITDEYYVDVLPLRWEHMMTYSHLQLNLGQDHRDPSDHVIISHAITNRIPLISSDRKFTFYTNQGLQLIFNEK